MDDGTLLLLIIFSVLILPSIMMSIFGQKAGKNKIYKLLGTENEEIIITEIKNSNTIYSSFRRRLGSQIIDAGLNTLLIPMFFNIYFYYSRHQTIGDKIFGIQIFSNMKNTHLSGWVLTFRFICKLLSIITLGIGFLMILWTEKKQGLHDECANTVVKNVTPIKEGLAFFLITISLILIGLSLATEMWNT